MGALLRFVTAVALLGVLITLLRAGTPLPAWIAAALLFGGLLLILYRGGLARMIVSVLGAIVVIYVLWGSGGGLTAVSSIAVLAVIMLALAIMLRPLWRGRY